MSPFNSDVVYAAIELDRKKEAFSFLQIVVNLGQNNRMQFQEVQDLIIIKN